VAELLVSDGDDVVDKFKTSDDAKEVADDVKPVSVQEGAVAADVLPHELVGGEEEVQETKKEKRAPAECLAFSVGKLRVNGIGALCSFGVAAATVCVLLVGGKLQHQQKQQHQQNIQLQFLGDDKVC
jgi:CO dehydrogenase/acetyl-CoA synthase beta subunit